MKIAKSLFLKLFPQIALRIVIKRKNNKDFDIIDLSNHKKLFLNSKLNFFENLILKIVPLSISGLNKCRILKLNNNNLKNYPKLFCKINNLEILYVNQNLMDKLPDNFKLLVNLKELYISRNSFIDFPIPILSLKYLEILHINENSILSIPNSIGSCLTRLESLNIKRNRLKSIPNDIDKLKQLHTLIIAYNPFKMLPKSINNLLNIKKLVISEDQTELIKNIGYDKSITAIPNIYSNYQNFFRKSISSLYDSIKGFLNHDSIILDIGSNIGMFTELIAKDGNYKHIYCFEPVKDYFEYSVNQLSEYKNIDILNLALGDSLDPKPIFKSIDFNIGINTFLENFLPDSFNELCNFTTLDIFVREYGLSQIHFIKIDVEGLEAKILRGFLSTLSKMKKKPIILTEIFLGLDHPNWNENKKIFNDLIKLGYKDVQFEKIGTYDVLFEPL